MNQNQGDKFTQRATEAAARKALKASQKAAVFAAKKVFAKLLLSILAALKPLLIPLILAALLFGFIYFSIFMIPKYMATAECQTVTFTATAATHHEYGRGTIAASSIPVNTSVRVSGYGHGLIIGNDTLGEYELIVYFDNLSEARAWGTREVRVNIFNKQNPPGLLHWGEGAVWTHDQDIELQQEYLELERDWIRPFQNQHSLNNEQVDHVSGNRGNHEATVSDVWNDVLSERAQVNQHRPRWALMASLDRVIGDPIIHHDQIMRKPEPEKRLKELKPINLVWEDFELYYYKRWEVEVTTTNIDGSTSTSCETRTKKYKHTIQLLTSIETIEGKYVYTWDKEIDITEHDADDCGDSFREVHTPRLVNIERTGTPYQKIKDVLIENNLTQIENVELVLQLAMNQDEEFKTTIQYYGIFSQGVFKPIDFLGTAGEIAWPTHGVMVSPFGPRQSPGINKNTGNRIPGGFHGGIDIANSSGTSIHAAANGVVVFAGGMGGFGKTVVINHGDFKTLNAHMSRIKVDVNDEVKQGYIVGLMGSTGNSTGPHLHFEYQPAGIRENPLLVLPAGEEVRRGSQVPPG